MIILTKEEQQGLLEFVKRGTTFALDIETTGLSKFDCVIMGIGISTAANSYYVPVHNFNPRFYSTNPTNKPGFHPRTDTRIVPCGPGEAFVTELLQLLATKKLLAFNAAFDIPFLEHHFKVPLLHALHADVMLLKHTVDETFPFDLKSIAKKIFGHDATAEKLALKEALQALNAGPKEYFKVDMKLLAQYCEQDCKLTYRLFNHYLPELEAQGLSDFFFTDEVMPLYKYVTIPMEAAGIAIDVPLLQQSKQEIDAEIVALEEQIQEAIAPYLADFNTWYLEKNYAPKNATLFTQGLVEYAGLNMPKLQSGRYSVTRANIKKLPESKWKRILMQEEYLEPEDRQAIQLLLHQKSGVKYPFNLSSKHHLKKLFFESLKEEPLAVTPKGNPKIDDAFLKLMEAKYNWTEQLRVYNKLIKIRGTYIDRFLEEAQQGRFYPRFFQHRTVSGRYGSDLQQLPRSIEARKPGDVIAKYNNRIRHFLLADPGTKLIGADYESLEPHIFAHVSGDERLKDIFRKGLDFYSTIAIKTEGLQGVSADKKAPDYLGMLNKAARQKAKSYSLGIPYGMTGYKLAKELDIPQEQAEQLVKDYLNAFPDLAAWMRRTQEFVLNNGYIVSEAGRIRHMEIVMQYYADYGDQLFNDLELWKANHDKPAVYHRVKKVRKEFKNYLNNANNFQIQSLAASIVNRAAIATNLAYKQAGMKSEIVMQVHDELVVRAPDAEVEQAAKILQECMENTYKISLPLKAKPTIGEAYGQLK